jgi:hypothetical protein
MNGRFNPGFHRHQSTYGIDSSLPDELPSAGAPDLPKAWPDCTKSRRFPSSSICGFRHTGFAAWSVFVERSLAVIVILQHALRDECTPAI